MKKIGFILLALVLSCSLFAEEHLKDYLDEIAEINQKESEADNTYSLLYQNTINQITTDAQMKLSEISRLEKYPWETIEAFSDRIASENEKVIQKRDQEMENFKNEYSALHNEERTALEAKKKKLADEMLKKEFCYKGLSSKEVFGKYDPYQQGFPLSVTCLESELAYSNANLLYSIDQTDIAESYYTAEAAINANEIDAEIYFQILRKNSFSDDYQKKITRIVLKGKDNSVLQTYEINEIISTFSIKVVVNEDSSIIPVED